MKIFRYRFKATIQYVFFAVVLMSGLYLLANYRLPFYTMLIFAGFLGLLIGIYQTYFHFPFFTKKPFWVRLFIELLVIQFSIMVVMILSRAVIDSSDLPNPHADMFSRLFHPESLRFYLRAQLFSASLIFLIELEKLLGKHFIVAYIFGRYRKPLQEERVMLFIDIKDSTAIAERLGDQMYYHFLNDCYERLGRATIITGAEILKYVGDEVVVSWRNKSNTKADQALEFYRIYRSSISKSANYFTKTYGISPQFSVGIHQGKVLVAFVGEIKKQLDFSGDLMNTTARICDACKKQNSEVLISDVVYQAIESKKYRCKIQSVGKVPLKGKMEEMSLYKFHIQSIESD